MNLAERVALAEKVRAQKQSIAEEVTAQFFLRHPDWLERYGDRGRRLGIEDACYHQDFLAGAAEAGSADSFQDYARWTAGMLESRGIAASFVVENLRQVESTLAPLLLPGERALVSDLISAGCAAIAEARTPVPAAGTPRGLALTRNLFLQALLQGSRKPALTVVLEALNQGANVADLYVDVFQSSLHEVGRLWQSNRITVAEEHTATAIAQYVLAQIYERLTPATPCKGKVVITGVEGELHQVGPNIVADALEADGWSVRFLGTNMPHSGILKIVDEHEADVVGISATMLFNLSKVRQLVTALRAKGTKRPWIVVGGAAFCSAPTLFTEIGADGFSPEVRSAVALLRQSAPSMARLETVSAQSSSRERSP